MKVLLFHFKYFISVNERRVVSQEKTEIIQLFRVGGKAKSSIDLYLVEFHGSLVCFCND